MVSKRIVQVKVWCAICGNEFTAHKPSAMYCSSACKQAAYRERKGQEKTPKRYGKGVNKTPAGKAIKKSRKTCTHCGRGFTPARVDAKYCSNSCRVVANRNKQYRTITKLRRESGLSDYEIMNRQDKHGWPFLYGMLEALGFTYNDKKQLWVNDCERQMELPL